MEYEGIVIRPPSEADSLILQVSLGCSHNKCILSAPLNKGRRFRIKDLAQIKEEIDEMAGYGPFRRVFLADGDALIIPQPKLVAIFDYLNEKISGLRRVGIYGNAKSILRKTRGRPQGTEGSKAGDPLSGGGDRRSGPPGEDPQRSYLRPAGRSRQESQGSRDQPFRHRSFGPGRRG